MLRNKYVFMDQAADGTQVGAGGGAADGAAGGAAASGAAGAQGAGDSGSGSSLLAQNAGAGSAAQGTGAAGTGAGAAGAFDWLPEKYRVAKEGGEVDIEASARKVAEAHGHLEKRLGTGDIPPKTADDYTLTVPDALKDQWKPEEDDLFQGFKKDAHAAGLTQKQFDFVMGKYLDIAPKMAGAGASLSAQEASTELRKLWPSEQQFGEGAGRADRAARAYANPGAADQLGSYVRLEKKFGNDPDFIALMANIGKETREDIPPMGSILPEADVETLQKSEAYWNANHKDHATTKAKVDAHYSRKFGNAPKR